MIAEILSTGDEIRSGSLTDTNSSYIAQALASAGVWVSRHQCVGDDMAALAAIMQEIGDRADIAVVTGGLGPTVDDLSAEAAAQAADTECVLDEIALACVQAYFDDRSKSMPESNRKQAMLPKGSDVLDNPVGTAPGFSLIIGKCRFFFMPGVPFEMRRMLAEQVLPRIEKMQGPDRPFQIIKTICTFGMHESQVGENLAGMNFPNIQLGLRAIFPQIQVKLYASGTDEIVLSQQLDEAVKWVTNRLNNKIFSFSGETLEAVVGDLLRQKNATISVAESCTGGLIANLLTDVPGSSDYFMFGGVTYANEAKINVLNVSPEKLETCGAVSEEVAGQMALGVKEIAGSTYGLATSGIAGPGGGTADKPVGTLCIGLAGPAGVYARKFHFKFASRAMYKNMFAMTALDMLRRELI